MYVFLLKPEDISSRPEGSAGKTTPPKPATLQAGYLVKECTA